MTYNTIGNDVTMAGGAQGALLANRYRIVRQLGQGGMGSVWLAEDKQLDGKLFAIKMLPSILVSNKRAYRQLKDEALVAMKLVHPNIVQLRAFEENGGNPFLVMDYIDGETLDDYLAEHIGTTSASAAVNAPAARSTSGTGGSPVLSGLPESEVIRLLKPIAAALDYAHSQGVVHRDVKPANVMIRKDGTPFILDFGISREMQETMTRVTGKLSSGTLLYMSPEQLNGDAPKPAQDVYSFAAMAYECLKGEPPFVRGDISDQIKNKVPESLPGGPRSCAAAIMSGLAKNPEDRPPSCAAVLGEGIGRVEHVERVEHAESDRGGARRRGGLVKALVKVVSAFALIGAFVLGALFVADWMGRPSKKDAIQSIIANMVKIPDKGFKMGRYEVTQAQWQSVMGENPSKFKYWFKWNNPVENVSWNDCKKFLGRLNALPEVEASGLAFRLPTEEEWEYACKAGGTGDYCRLAEGAEITESIVGRVAWYDDNSENETHPVGQKKPNAFGLYDMHGNVWEWCDGKENASGTLLALRLRGGGWGDGARDCRSAGRGRFYPGNRADSRCGFRLCCSVNDEACGEQVERDRADRQQGHGVCAAIEDPLDEYLAPAPPPSTWRGGLIVPIVMIVIVVYLVRSAVRRYSKNRGLRKNDG